MIDPRVRAAPGERRLVRTQPTGHRWLPFGLVALTLILATAGCDRATTPRQVALGPTMTATPAGTSRTGTPRAFTSATGTPRVTSTVPVSPGAKRAHRRLTPSQLKKYRPNELGYIPVLEYHAITTDPAKEAQFVRLASDLRADLTWLYKHDFHVISMASFVRNRITAPPGKHPVVLTFDDAQSSQFLFVRDKHGKLVPDPDTAVGVLEAFFTRHPDFGRGGFFAILPDNCFAVPDHEDQMKYCDRKLKWLVDHGYEVGNHTLGHQDLLDVSDAEFKRQIAENILWLEKHAPKNLGTVIAMPYGNYPQKGVHDAQRQMMEDGFTYKGRKFKLEGALMVGSEPSVSPSSELWDPIWIPRIQAADAVLSVWFNEFENGDVILFTSDGNPETVTIPNPVPRLIREEINPDLIRRSGKTLVRYTPPRADHRTRGQPGHIASS